MAQDSHDTILFLERDRVGVYDANNILRLDMPPQVVRDIDIIDKSGFDTLIDSFIKTKKLNPGKLWIILSDAVCFSKDIVDGDTPKIEGEVKDFLEAVPFDQIISKRFRSQGGIRVIASNLELIEAVIEIFERNGFDTEAITPSAIFPGGVGKKILDPEFAKYIITNKNLVRQGNMLAKVAGPAPAPESSEPKKKNKLLPYLLAGFGLLLAILVSVLLTRK
jgi:hypothetical protein